MQSTSEQRRMAGGVERRAQAGDVVAHRRGGVGLHGQHGLDPPLGIGAQPRLEAVGVGGRAEAEVEDLDLDSHAPRRLGPAEAEAAGGERERVVAGREDVGERRLPAGVAVADIDRDLAARCARRA